MNGPRAEVVSIGTEILLGEIVDTNTATIARALRSVGVDLYRTTTVGDNVNRIARALREASARADVIIATGGLGPTVDDVTRAGVAAALGTQAEFRAELWGQIQERFARFDSTPGENNRRQAYLPRGATAIENPLGTAPAFYARLGETLIFALPGVPAEMEHLLFEDILPHLARHFDRQMTIQTRLLHTAGIGESTLDAEIGDLERAANPSLGVSAHPGRVDLRLTAKADTEEEANSMLAKLERDIRERLSDWIYGADNETLEGVVLQALAGRGWELVSVEAGTGGALSAALAGPGSATYRGGYLLPAAEGASTLDRLQAEMSRLETGAGIGLQLADAGDTLTMRSWLRTPDQERDLERTYTGPLANAAPRSVALCLEMARRSLLDI